MKIIENNKNYILNKHGKAYLENHKFYVVIDNKKSCQNFSQK